MFVTGGRTVSLQNPVGDHAKKSQRMSNFTQQSLAKLKMPVASHIFETWERWEEQIFRNGGLVE